MHYMFEIRIIINISGIFHQFSPRIDHHYLLSSDFLFRLVVGHVSPIGQDRISTFFIWLILIFPIFLMSLNDGEVRAFFLSLLSTQSFVIFEKRLTKFREQ